MSFPAPPRCLRKSPPHPSRPLLGDTLLGEPHLTLHPCQSQAVGLFVCVHLDPPHRLSRLPQGLAFMWRVCPAQPSFPGGSGCPALWLFLWPAPEAPVLPHLGHPGEGGLPLGFHDCKRTSVQKRMKGAGAGLCGRRWWALCQGSLRVHFPSLAAREERGVQFVVD